MLEYNADIHKVITSNEEPAVLDGSREVFFSGTQFGKIQKFDRFLLKPADKPSLSGREEAECVRHLFQRLSILLVKGNAALFLNRQPHHPEPEIDGVEWTFALNSIFVPPCNIIQYSFMWYIFI